MYTAMCGSGDRGPYSILRRYYDGKLFTVIGDVAVSESVELLTSLCTIKPAVDTPPSSTGYTSWIGAGAGVLVVGLWILWRRRECDERGPPSFLKPFKRKPSL